MKEVTIAEGIAADLANYGVIPIRFEVKNRFEVVGDDPATAQLIERPVDQAWTKDYDGERDNRPASWPRQWNLANWGVLAAELEEQRVGGAVVAWNTPGVHMLAGRDDLAVLWDLRVHPDYRGRGIGKALFKRAISWARERGCGELHVETQNINVAACRFYASQGCRLIKIDRQAYPDLPDEIQLLWGLGLL